METFTVVSLQVVRAVAEAGSFTAAAESMGYTQSAISRQVALAERAAGRPLFERHARGVELTEAGRLVLRHAAAVLAELEAVRHALDDFPARRPGRVRVGAFSTAMAALVPRAVARVAALDPTTHFRFNEGTSSTQLDRVARGTIDVAVARAPERWPRGVRVRPLGEDALLLAVHRGHRLAGRVSVRADELEHEPWIAGSARQDTEFLGPWTAATWTPQVAFVARSWMAKLGLVGSGAGVTLVPSVAAPAVPGTLALVQIDDPAAARRLAAATRADAPEPPRARALIDALHDVAADLGVAVRQRLRS